MRIAFLVPAPDFPEPWRWAFDAEAAALVASGVEAEQVIALEGELFRRALGDVSVALLISAKTGVPALVEFTEALAEIVTKCDDAMVD